MKRGITVFVCIALCTAIAQAETYYMTASDTSSSSGSTSFNKWNIAGGGTEPPSAGNHYVVDAGYRMRFPNGGAASGGVFAWPGESLRIGTVGSSEGQVVFTRTSNTTYTFNNTGLVLEKGRIQPWTGNVTNCINGVITVTAPESAPFDVMLSDTSDHPNQTFRIGGTLKGDVDTALRVYANAANYPASLYLTPNDATEFCGKIIVGNGDASKSVLCEAANNKTMPGGLHITGGSSFSMSDSSKTWTMGSLELDPGAALRLARSGQNSAKIVVNGTVDATYPVTVKSGYSDADASTWPVWGTPYTILKTAGVDAGLDAGAFTNDIETSLGGTKVWAEFANVPADGGESLQMTYRKSVQLKPGETNSTESALGGFSGFYTAMTNAAAWSDGCLPTNGVDYCANAASNQVLSLAPHDAPGYDGTFVFPGESLTIGYKTGEEPNYDFSDDGFRGGDVNLYSAANTTYIKVLRMYHNGRYWPKSYAGSSLEGENEVFVEGEEIECLATGAVRGGSYIRCHGRDRTFFIKPQLTGAGRMVIYNNGSSDWPNATVVLKAENTNFFGRLRVDADNFNGKHSSNYANTLVVEDARQLGGELAEFTYDALDIRGTSTLKATNDVDFATANRGVLVYGDATFEVGGGATLTLSNPVSYYGALTKTGAGRLVLGAEARFEVDAVSGATVDHKTEPETGRNRLHVAEGALGVSATNALDGLKVSFGDTASWEITVTSRNSGLGYVNTKTASPFDLSTRSDGKIPLLISSTDYDVASRNAQVKIPFLTVLEAAAATLDGKFALEFGEGTSGIGVEKRSNGDGTATFWLVRTGETLYLTVDDASGKSSFTDWNDSATQPSGAPIPANDYVVETNFTVRTTKTAACSFNGNSLRFGSTNQYRIATDKSGRQKAMGKLAAVQGQTIEFGYDGAILEVGRFAPWFTGGTVAYTGAIDVRSPYGVPFHIEISDSVSHLGNTVNLQAKFTGDAGSAFATVNHADNPAGRVRLDHDPESTFAGTVIVGNSSIGDVASSTYPAVMELAGSKTWPGKIEVRSGANGGSTLKMEDASSQWSVGSLTLAANTTLDMPRGASSAAKLTVRDSMAATGPVTVKLGYESGDTSAITAYGEPVEIVSLPVGSTVDAGAFTSGVLTNDEGRTRIWAGFSKTEGSLNAIYRKEVCLMPDQVESNVERALATDGFYTATTNAAAWSDNAVPQSGVDYVANVSNQVLNIAPASLQTAGAYTFPGASLTLGYKTGAEPNYDFSDNGFRGGDVNLSSAANTTRINVLRLYHNARYWPKCYVSGGHEDVFVEGGEIACMATGAVRGASYLRCYGGDRTFFVNPELTGAGRLVIYNNFDSDAPSATVVLRAANTNFFGRLRVDAGKGEHEAGYANTLVVEDPRQLGGELAEFTYDALDIRGTSTVKVTNDVEFATANRGVLVYGDATFDVGDGATLALANPVSYYGKLTKTGLGRLALGAEARFEVDVVSGETVTHKTVPEAGKNLLHVAEGSLNVACSNALDGVKVSFGESGAWAMAIESHSAVLGDAGRGYVNTKTDDPFGLSTRADGKIPIALDISAETIMGMRFKIPFLTVTETAAAAIGGKFVISTSTPTDRITVLRNLNGDGTVTFLLTNLRGFAILYN